jgi:hypothetical protein
MVYFDRSRQEDALWCRLESQRVDVIWAEIETNWRRIHRSRTPPPTHVSHGVEAVTLGAPLSKEKRKAGGVLHLRLVGQTLNQ